MKWILSFFSSSSHIEYLLSQLEQAQKSVVNVRNECAHNRECLNEYVYKRTEDIAKQERTADKLEKLLSVLS